MKPQTILNGVVGILVLSVSVSLIYYFVVYIPKQKLTPKVISQETIETSEPLTKDFVLDVIHAISKYHFASISMDDIDYNNSDTLTTDIMTGLMNSNKRLQSGDVLIEDYKNNEDEIVRLVTEGMLLGSSQVSKANSDLLQFLKNRNENSPTFINELEYAIAQKISDEKEGYGNIIIFIGQIGYLIFEPAESENPTGPIPYKITKEERTSLIKEIDRLFSEDLEEYRKSAESYNAMIMAVDTIRNFLVSDTYEESAKLKVE